MTDPRLTLALENVLTTDWKKLVETFVEEERSRTRQEEREKVVEYIKANSALTDNPIESNGQLIDCSYYQIYAGALEQARNLT